MEIIDINSRAENKNKEFKETKNSKAINFLTKVLDENISIKEFNEAFDELIKGSPEKNFYSFVGDKESNSSNIEVATDPGRAIIERLTNGIDSVLEDIFNKRKDENTPTTPHEAAEKWLGISQKQGLKSLSYSERMKLGKEFVTVRQFKGDSSSNQIIDVIDKGTGLNQNEFKTKILSISASNKIRKKYVMGQYGHGGSSTFAFTKKTLIVSKTENSNHVSFTVVWYLEPEDHDETMKIGSYVYFTENNLPISLDSKKISFEKGTIIRHFGYDAAKYSQPLGTKSIYGNCQKILFNPPIPYVLRLPNVGNRSMIGARASLMGAFDEADKRTKIEVDHYQSRSCIMISDGQLGKIWIEYWLASKPKRIEVYNKKKKKKEWQTPSNPINSLIDKTKPIIFTNNGQNQHEESANMVASSIGLPFLKNRLVIHIDCNELAPVAKRNVFSSTRERIKESSVTKEILNQVINFVKSDDQLKILDEKAAEEEAQDANLHNKDYLKKEVSKLLNLKGGDLATLTGYKGDTTKGKPKSPKPKNPSPRPKVPKKHIKLTDPPTYINLLWPDDRDINFYKGRQRWIRVETDAHNFYQNKINFSINGSDLEIVSKTDLNDGRLRFLVICKDKSLVGNSGSIEIKLEGDNNLKLSDKRTYKIVQVPEEKELEDDQPTQPDYECIPVKGKSDEKIPFGRFFENEDDAELYDEGDVSFHYVFLPGANDSGKLRIYYNTEFKNFKSTLNEIQQKGTTAKVNTLQGEYEIFLCALAYLDHNEKENNKYNKEGDKKNQTNTNLQDMIRVKNNSFSGAGLLMIRKELLKRNSD